MSKIWMMLLWFGLSACQATDNAQSAGSNELLGVVSAQQILQSYPEFSRNYQRYTPSDNELAALKALQGKSLVVLFGGWCHDSEREVPRLLKVLDSLPGQLNELTFIAVNRNKQEPTGAHRRLDLRYTPTFILFDGSEELGRVIERPTQSLTEDLAALLR